MLVLLACTDDNSSVGGTTVDPNAVTAEVLGGWYNFGTGLPKDSVSKLTGGTLNIQRRRQSRKMQPTAPSEKDDPIHKLWRQFPIRRLYIPGIRSGKRLRFHIQRI